MKKLLNVLVIALVLITVPAMAFAGGASDKSALQTVKDRGRLIVGTEAQYAPYEFKDMDANIVGCDMYIAQQIADELGVGLEIVDMAFDGITDRSVYNETRDIPILNFD